MKHTGHLIFPLLLFIVNGCSNSNKEFATYEINPLKEAYVKNRVTSYVNYGFINGELFYGDSISLDRYGNINSKISIGGLDGITNYSYDSLNRLIKETNRSDIAVKMMIEYLDNPSDRTVTKHIRSGHISDSLLEISNIEILKYNHNLTRIISKTEVNTFFRDTFITNYTYQEDRIVREEKGFKDEINGIVTEYKYDKGKLLQIKRIYPPASHKYEIDYISDSTGLRDSTLLFEKPDKSVKLYKYYYSDR